MTLKKKDEIQPEVEIQIKPKSLPRRIGGNCEFCGTPICEHYSEPPILPYQEKNV